jgi:hypothetical protein
MIKRFVFWNVCPVSGEFDNVPLPFRDTCRNKSISLSRFLRKNEIVALCVNIAPLYGALFLITLLSLQGSRHSVMIYKTLSSQ